MGFQSETAGESQQARNAGHVQARIHLAPGAAAVPGRAPSALPGPHHHLGHVHGA